MHQTRWLVAVGLGLAGLLLAGMSWIRAADTESQKIQIVAERFHFTPSKIEVKRGVVLEIELTSEDTFHGFRIPAANLNVTIPARGRGSVKVRFQANAAGSYPFECSRPCGAGHTLMRGVIEVE